MIKPKYFKKILLLFSVCVLTMCILYALVFMYIKTTNENIHVLQKQLAVEIANQHATFSTQSMVEMSNSDIVRVNNAIIPKEGDVPFIENLENLARINHLSITINSLSLENDPALTSTDMTILNIRTKTSGSWTDIYRFISYLESLSQEIQIKKIELASSEDDSGLPSSKIKKVSEWQAQFEIRVLKYK